MASAGISRVGSRDVRFQLKEGEGADAVHSAPEYSYAVTEVEAGGLCGTGLVLTLGAGNELVCSAIDYLAPVLLGRDIEELMGDFGRTFHALANHDQLRWLGPHTGVMHLAL